MIIVAGCETPNHDRGVFILKLLDGSIGSNITALNIIVVWSFARFSSKLGTLKIKVKLIEISMN